VLQGWLLRHEELEVLSSDKETRRRVRRMVGVGMGLPRPDGG